MRRLLTRVIAEEMYNYLEREKSLPEEQKGCKRGSRGTKDQLLIDKTALNDCKKRHTNLSMAWIEYRKAYKLNHIFMSDLKRRTDKKNRQIRL